MNFGEVKKVIIISDTHLGGNAENLNYLDIVYNFAKKNNISIIIHGGDLLDGLMDCYKTKYQTYYKQIEHVINDYPKDKGINNYILYGNHDYKCIRDGYNLNILLSERRDFSNIGIESGYVNINQILFEISHPIKHYKVYDQRIPFINFKGHSHRYGIGTNNRQILIPTLSDDIKLSSSLDGLPGFIVVEFNYKTINVINYNIKNNKNEISEGNSLVYKI